MVTENTYKHNNRQWYNQRRNFRYGGGNKYAGNSWCGYGGNNQRLY